MKKRRMVLITLAMSMTMAATVRAGTFDKLYDFLDYLSDDPPQSVTVSGDYEYTVNADGETITIIDYTGDEEVVEIPPEINGYSVTDIAEQAFSYTKMKHLIFPDSISTIGPRAFEYCELTDVTIPFGAEVGRCAFGYCDFLTQVNIGPQAVIRSRAFGYCEDLETVVCGAGSRLETDTFEYCDDLEKVILCGDVTVEDGAFYDCDKMEMIRAEESEYENWKLPDADTQINNNMAGVLAGGWKVTADSSVTEKAQEVFDQAMPDHDRVDYDAVALLATQVAAGTNYCFLRRTNAAEPDEAPSYQLVYIYEDLQGNANVLEVQDIEFGLDGKGEDGKPEPLKDGEYSITLTGDEYVFADCPSAAKAGEIVMVHTADVTDGEVKIEVNGSDTGRWLEWGTYAFIMPEEDVELHGWISTDGYPGA